jgi:hypothetical protein
MKKKQKKKSIEKKRLENEEQGEQSQSSSAGESSNCSATGSQRSPIAVDCQFIKARLCQYPAHRPYHDSSLPQPYYGSSLPEPVGFGFTAFSAIQNPVPHGTLHTQLHSNQFTANHNHLESTEVEEDSLFVSQTATHCANAITPWRPNYYQQ